MIFKTILVVSMKLPIIQTIRHLSRQSKLSRINSIKQSDSMKILNYIPSNMILIIRYSCKSMTLVRNVPHQIHLSKVYLEIT